MSTTETDPELVPFLMRGPGKPFPPPEYDALRAQRPVRAALPDGTPVWLVTRHADVRAVLTDRRISSNPDREGFPRPNANGGAPSATEVPGWFVSLDPPEHDRFRRALIPEFSVRRVREMRPAIQQVVDRVVDDLLARDGEADLVADFALPVPSLVISALLGVPEVDRDFFESRTRTLVTIGSADADRDTATEQLLRYLNRLIAIRTRRPGEDVLSRLVTAGDFTPEELSGVAMLLLIAGHETTANNIALGAVTLLTHPEWIGADGLPDELLRLHSVADIVALRVAVSDVEIGGRTIAAGEGIVPLIAAANHDPEVFGECPARFAPSRESRQHVAFGFGVHQCLGQNLVRTEMELAYRTLFERVPGLRLGVPAEELPIKYDGVLFGLHALPVRW